MTRRPILALIAGFFGLVKAPAALAATEGGAAGAAPSPNQKWRLTAAEWQKRLSPAQFDVLRKEGTERAGSSALNAEKRAGAYHCAGCDLPLFASTKKYESGTGWPSFFEGLPGALATKTDYKAIFPRTEYHCVRCEGHQGHVFNDGPKPSGKRYCNNGVALKFLAAV